MTRKITVAFLCILLNQLTNGFDLNHLNLPAEGKIWALIAAGSYTYVNYRHQADVCHAYHVLRSHGIPEEQIITMMYDDIAYNKQNPTPGVILNHPNGTNVYQGVVKDYTKLDVTPKNFLNILQGNIEEMKGIGSGKVIKSGPNDHIFVYFADHGSIGLVAFPFTELHATELNSVLKSMYQKKKFAKMVFYMEACESGSMFNNLLPDNINVYATTAANPSESSLACYWDDKRGAYLGDVYSVKWMEDSDKENLSKETLKKQFELVKKETNESHVQEYGDLNIANLKLAEFQGEKPGYYNMDELPSVPFETVISHEVPVKILEKKIQTANSFEEHRQLKKELTRILRNRDFLSEKIQLIVKAATYTSQQLKTILNEQFELRDFECFDEVVHYFSNNCFSLSGNTYALRHTYTFVNMCETGIPASKQIEAMDAVCVHPPTHGVV